MVVVLLLVNNVHICDIGGYKLAHQMDDVYTGNLLTSTLANSVDLDECHKMLHYIRVYTVC